MNQSHEISTVEVLFEQATSAPAGPNPALVELMALARRGNTRATHALIRSVSVIRAARVEQPERVAEMPHGGLGRADRRAFLPNLFDLVAGLLKRPGLAKQGHDEFQSMDPLFKRRFRFFNRHRFSRRGRA